MEATRLDRQRAVLAGMFLVDSHVHCHAGVDPALFLTAADRSFSAHAREGNLVPAAGVLLFTEVAEARVFETLRAAGGLAGWRLERTLEDVSLIAHGPGATPLILIAGRQIVTAEGLEVLALGAAGPFADRMGLEATVEAVRAAGGVPVLPWGFGKWWGARGKALARFLERARPGTVFLGDNGGRLGSAPAPALFARAAARGIVVLPGSDALPLAAEATKVGSYGFVLEGEIDPARPAAALKRLIRALRTQPRSFGRLQRLAPFAARQFALRLRGRGGARLPHDTLTPDIETASEAYARRFAGPVGAYMLEVQRAQVMALLGARPGERLRILEVGGGHAQLAPALVAAGHEVVVQGSSPGCGDRLRPWLLRHPDRLRFVAAPLWHLPFADGTFDAVIGVRLLAHVERHEALLAEMARVSRGVVIVDFPPLLGANLLTPVLFRIKHRIEGNTRPYVCYLVAQLRRPLAAAGCTRFRTARQLALPMALHRRLARPDLSARLEGLARRFGLTALLGAPVLLAAARERDGR